MASDLTASSKPSSIEICQNGGQKIVSECEENSTQGVVSLVLDFPEENDSKPTRFYIGGMLSGIYALILTLLGFLLPFVEATEMRWLNEPVIAGFYGYIFVVGTTFLIYVQIALTIQSRSAKEQESPPQQRPMDVCGQTYGSINHAKVKRIGEEPSKDTDLTPQVEQSKACEVAMIDRDGFRGSFGHEGSSFYLRIGTLFFGIGNIIYVALELDYRFTDAHCHKADMAWIYIFQLLFILSQTFFVFKNPKIHMKRGTMLARVGFMHLVATNICVWSRTLVSEVFNDLQHHSSGTPAPFNHPELQHGMKHIPGPQTYHLHGTAPFVDGEEECDWQLVADATPYLFPFVLEYSLICMATAGVMYTFLSDNTDHIVVQNIHKNIKANARDKEPVSQESNQSEPDKSMEMSLLYKSHCGMFCGIMLLTGSLIAMIFFFVEADDMAIADDPVKPQVIYLSCDIVIHLVLLVAVVIALYKIRHMSIKSNKPMSIDDVLILVSMAGSFLFEVTLIIPTAYYVSSGKRILEGEIILALIASSVAATQTVCQVFLILTGLRAYSSTHTHLKEMPGRGTMTFLLVGNVAVWLFRSVQVKELEMGIQEDFYGHVVWVIIMSLCLPILLFFRFHSSVCFADIWEMAYKTNGH